MAKVEFFDKLNNRIQKAVKDQKKVFLHISTNDVNIDKKIEAINVEICEEEIDIHSDDFNMEFKCKNAEVEYRNEIDFDSFEFVSGENYIALDCPN